MERKNSEESNRNGENHSPDQTKKITQEHQRQQSGDLVHQDQDEQEIGSLSSNEEKYRESREEDKEESSASASSESPFSSDECFSDQNSEKSEQSGTEIKIAQIESDSDSNNDESSEEYEDDIEEDDVYFGEENTSASDSPRSNLSADAEIEENKE